VELEGDERLKGILKGVGMKLFEEKKSRGVKRYRGVWRKGGYVVGFILLGKVGLGGGRWGGGCFRFLLEKEGKIILIVKGRI
jgi:hypothetical protein